MRHHPVKVRNQVLHAPPLVSVSVITYNHERYICECIDSILDQEVTFSVEILVHDDASTDETANILLRYKQQFPSIIKCILQSSNQYSRGIKISPSFNYPRARGRFIALCEGDDLWLSKNKLQLQAEAMLANPNAKLSFHPCKTGRTVALSSCNLLGYHSSRPLVFVFDDVVAGGGGFIPTPSIMFAAECVSKFPDWYYSLAPVGDYYLQVLASLHGGALYIPDLLSFYRTGVPGSWSSSQRHRKPELIIAEAEAHRLCLEQVRLLGASQASVNTSISRELAYASQKAFLGRHFHLVINLLNLSRSYSLRSCAEQIQLFRWRHFLPILFVLKDVKWRVSDLLGRLQYFN